MPLEPKGLVVLREDFAKVAGDGNIRPDQIPALLALHLSREPTDAEVNTILSAFDGQEMGLDGWIKWLQTDAPADAAKPVEDPPATHQELAELVVKALSSDAACWATDPTKLIVKEVSKGGAKRGAFVFKLTAPGGAAVGLHRGPNVQSENFLMRKTEAATLVFSEAGLAPPRLATGPDWFIEEWWDANPCHWPHSSEENSDWTDSVEKWKEYGGVTAKFHQLSTSWWEVYKEEAIKENPWAAGLPMSSRAWMYLMIPHNPAEAKGLQFIADHPDFSSEYADLGPIAPRHPLAAKTVTVHNDHHPLNMIDLSNGGGLRVIDLETASVDWAIGDIASGPASCDFDPIKSRAFVEGYLEAAGHAVTEEDVQMLLLDTYIWGVFACRVWMSPPGFLGLTEDEAKERLACWMAYAEAVRASETEQRELFERGPQKSFALKGLIDLE